MNLAELFMQRTAFNGIKTVNFDEIKEKLTNLGFSNENYYIKNNTSIVKALSASAQTGSAVIDVSDKKKLSCIIDTKELIILIDRSNICRNMYSAYKKAKNLSSSEYLLFVSQESKTADVEKALISGVQASEKLTFVLT